MRSEQVDQFGASDLECLLVRCLAVNVFRGDPQAPQVVNLLRADPLVSGQSVTWGTPLRQLSSGAKGRLARGGDTLDERRPGVVF
jgi:hypothetical protein